jgi:hypothetical protein
VVVGIRARTSHSTSGSFGSKPGRGVLDATDVSTGIERGGRGCEGVEVPGVAGGVKAGLIIDAGGSRWCVALAALLRIACLSRSSSEFGSSNGSWRPGCGLYRGGKPGEACEGSADMAARGGNLVEGKEGGSVYVGAVMRSGACCGRKCGRACCCLPRDVREGLRLANSDCGTRHSRLLAADIAPICPSQSAFV